MKKVLITGARGFVGAALIKHLKQYPYELVALVRPETSIDAEVSIVYANLDDTTRYEEILAGIDVVIHLAGRAHVLKETESDPYQAFAAINVDATKKLAMIAAEQGVERFIYMSTTKVCGETTRVAPLNESSPCNPSDDYAKTKAIAENIIQAVCESSAMHYVIIRPPLVYGPGVKANFKRLLSLSRSRLPIPLGAIQNQRSLIYIENLVDFVNLTITHPHAENQVFFVSDDEDLSTAQLIRSLAKYQGRKVYLPAVSKSVIEGLFNWLLPGLYAKLCESLQLDITKAKNTLGWKPPFTPQAGLRKTVQSS